MKCPNCGTENTGGRNICKKCGARLINPKDDSFSWADDIDFTSGIEEEESQSGDEDWKNASVGAALFAESETDTYEDDATEQEDVTEQDDATEQGDVTEQDDGSDKNEEDFEEEDEDSEIEEGVPKEAIQKAILAVLVGCLAIVLVTMAVIGVGLLRRDDNSETKMALMETTMDESTEINGIAEKTNSNDTEILQEFDIQSVSDTAASQPTIEELDPTTEPAAETAPVPTTTTAPVPTTTTAPVPTTTTVPVPTTTAPVPTTTTAPAPTTTTAPAPTTTAPVPTTTTAPAPTTTAPVPTTTAPVPTTTAPVPTTTAPEPTSSAAGTVVNVSGGEYSVSGGKATLTRYAGTAAHLELPEEVNGVPLTFIGRDAFKGNTMIQQIDIPEGVLTVGEDAFYGCSSLNAIVIPDSMVLIGEGAFNYCSSFVAYCHSGTYAETFCNQWNVKWIEGDRLP